MRVNRGLRTALALIPVVFFLDRPVAADSALASAAQVLPRGIHLGRDARFYQDLCDQSAHRHCYAQRMLPETYRPGDEILPQAGSTPPLGTMGPTELLAAYSIPPTSAAKGKIVAILDMPDTNAFADLTMYRTAMKLPPLPKCAGTGLPDGKTPCFAVVDENGAPNPVGLTDGGPADGETGLDMDMVSAVCPDCSILLVEMSGANAPQDQDFILGAATAKALGALATSISFGGPETGADAGGDPTGFSAPGYLVVAASGDQGYLLETAPQGQGGTSPSYPSSAPDVLGIGGTNVTAGGAGGYTETVWSDQSGAAGSGCSTEFPMPAFQTAYGANRFGSCAMRATSDVSAAAQFTPAAPAGGGIAEYDSAGGFSSVVGTSAAAPIVAAAFVRMGVAEDVSNDLGFVYEHAAAFNDVTSGNNDSRSRCAPADAVLCTAGAGWDGPTGIGTPSGRLAPLAGTGGVPDGGASDAALGVDSSALPSDGGVGEGGAQTNMTDAGSALAPSGTSGCAIAAPGSQPLEDTALGVMALGAIAAFAASQRRRRR